MAKVLGIAAAARDVGVSEGGLRRLERKGIVHPTRDQWGRRLFGSDDIEAARRYLTERQRSATAGSQGAAA